MQYVAYGGVILECPICRHNEFRHFKLIVHVETKKGVAYLQQYECLRCHNLLFFNFRLDEK